MTLKEKLNAIIAEIEKGRKLQDGVEEGVKAKFPGINTQDLNMMLNESSTWFGKTGYINANQSGKSAILLTFFSKLFQAADMREFFNSLT